MNFKTTDWIVLTILFILALWLWTLPIKNNLYPFGEGDAAWHFANSDWAAQSDYSFWRSPSYIGNWYYGYNKALGPFALEYPPPWHLDGAFMQIVGGERVVPVYIYIAISCFLTIFSFYFLIRKLYGFYPALIVSVGLLFSWRDILTYLWGQRPGLTSFAYIPMILYALYCFLVSFYKSEKKAKYLYFLSLLFASCFLIHLQAVIYLVPAIAIFIIWMWFANKKSIFVKSNLKHMVINLILIFIICAPFALIYFGTGQANAGFGIGNLSRLFYWFKIPPNNLDLNPAFFSYDLAYVSLFTLPLVIIGIIFLFIKRKPRDILLLSMLLALYFILHLDIFKITELNYRLARYLSIETYIFYSLIAIGLINLPELFRIGESIKKYVSLALVIILLIFIVPVQGKQAYSTLNSAYQGVLRITPYQYEATDWIRHNLDKDALINHFGTLTYPKSRFMMVLSQRVFSRGDINNQTFLLGYNVPHNFTHVLFDYSDYVLIGDQAKIAEMQQSEEYIKPEAQLLYDKDYIRVYKLG